MDMHATLLKQLLPASYDTGSRVLSASLQAEGNALDAAVLLAEQLLAEDDPRTAMQLIPDWERVLGSCSRSQYQIGPGKYSIATSDLIDFARASTATYVDGGVLKTAAANEPRYENGNLLIEPVATNRLWPSENFTAWWTAENVTVTANNAVAPDGTTTADKVVASTLSAAHRQVRNINLVAGVASVFSVFVKPTSINNHVFLLVWTPTNSWSVAINLQTGNKIVGSSSQFTAEPMVNGWWRVSLTGTPNASAAYAHMIYQTDATGISVMAGDGINGLWCWGSNQTDESLSSYIPAGYAQVTRTADIAHTWMPLSIQQRRSFLIGKLNEIGGQSKQYFIDLAKSLGYTITIDEFGPANVLADVMAPMYTSEWYFVWRINAAVNANYRQATVMDTVMEAFASWGSADFEAAMREDAPAHTQVLFAYI